MTIVHCLEYNKYNKIFLGKLESDEYVTVEELVEGSFVKHINNNEHICGDINNPILRMKQQQHDIELWRARKKIRVPDGI